MLSINGKGDCMTYLRHLFLLWYGQCSLFIIHQSSICYAPPLHSSFCITLVDSHVLGGGAACLAEND